MKKIVMLGTRFDTMGGISSVVNVYRAAGLFERFPVQYLATHCDGGKLAKLKTAVSALLRFIGLLLTGQVVLLHIHFASRASFWRKSGFYALARLFRVPVILHLHGGGFHVFYQDECGPWQQKWIRYVFDHAARVVVLSQTWRQWLQGISRNPHIVPIYNPVQVPDWQADPATAKPPTPPTLLVLGRLTKLKGSYDLLAACAPLVAEFPALRLALGGDGELEQVAARAQELGIGENVKLLGWIGAAEKERELQQASLYVLPSYHEGMPMSLLEAMAAGLPVISTRVGGIPELVSDGVDGILLEPGDINGLTDALRRLLQNGELARQMGRAGRQKIESTFATSVILPQIEQLYLELGAARLGATRLAVPAPP
jgi:glycosyltransferase involved in cell wall biosynthesis